MVWRKKYRRRKRTAALKQKQPIITAIETGNFITDNARCQLRRTAWRAQHTNLLSNLSTIEIIDLTRNSDEIPNAEYIKSTELQFISTDYMIKIS